MLYGTGLEPQHAAQGPKSKMRILLLFQFLCQLNIKKKKHILKEVNIKFEQFWTIQDNCRLLLTSLELSVLEKD